MPPITFNDWDLESNISDAIKGMGWEEPTQIQTESIPVARRGKDVVGQARTGSGKTAAFGIPIIESCKPDGSLQSLVLCPTRELAVQVAEEMSNLQGKKSLKIGHLVLILGRTYGMWNYQMLI